MKKSLFKSKTFWFNTLSLVVAAASGQLGFDLPANVAAPIVAVGNLLLRVVTKEPVKVISE